jgi:hypothetical protein
MSMNEFEEQSHEEENDSGTLLTHGQVLPRDFSEEDVAFAQELNSFFALDEEKVPPYFVQTLLEPDNPRFRVVEHGFEEKTRARVFRRLNLRRRLFKQRWSSLDVMPAAPLRRSWLVLVAACMLFVLFTVAFTGQSFVEGVSFLLQGARAGVYQVHSYPMALLAPSYDQNNGRPSQISLTEAQQRLHFPMYWPLVTPKNFDLDSIYLFQNTQQTWADGPILELQYDYSSPATPVQGSGEIAILEFKPNDSVLQIIGGAPQTVLADAKGNPEAIYVNGQWVSPNRYSHRWMTGGRNELIYQRDGIVFWIVGDQRDGIDKAVLLSMAQSLRIVDATRFMHEGVQMTATQLENGSSGLFTGDIIAVGSDDGLSGPYLIRLGPDQPPQEKPVEKHAMHAS